MLFDVDAGYSFPSVSMPPFISRILSRPHTLSPIPQFPHEYIYVPLHINTCALHRVSCHEAVKRKIKEACESLGQPPPALPEINALWVWRFMKKYKIVWRKCTVQYAVSRAKMERRAKRCWKQSSQIQYGLQLLHGKERQAQLLGRFKTHIVPIMRAGMLAF